ncbi:histidine kinase [Candidatus Electronema halotolerans]
MLQLSLRNRFILYFSPLIAVIFALSLFCICTFSSIHSQFHKMQQDVAFNVSAMLELKKLLLSLEAGLREKHIDRRSITAKAAQLKELITKHNARHSHQNTDPASLAAHEMLHHSILAMTLSQYILEESAQGWPEEEFAQIAVVVREELKKMEAVIDEHLHLHLQELTKTEAFVTEKYQHTLIVVALTSAVAVLLTVAVFVLMLRSVLGPVRILEEGTRQIGAGNLQHRLGIHSGDEFEFLAQEFEKMAEQLTCYHEDLDAKVQERTEELVQANAELRRAEEQVHHLTQQLLAVQENERQQIALYLHDQVAQELSSLKIAGDSFFSEPVEDELALTQARHDWGRQIDRCIKTVRELSYNLRPPGLEQIGLASALADCCRAFARKSGIPVRFSKAGADKLPLAAEHAINIYRLVQEALNNIGKHAQASQADVRLIASGANVILRIEDNGSGFAVEEICRKVREKKRFGLLGMQERVRVMNGTFRLQSAPGEGVKIFIEFPSLISPQEDQAEPQREADNEHAEADSDY